MPASLLDQETIKTILSVAGTFVAAYLTFRWNSTKTERESEIAYRKQLLDQINHLSERLTGIEDRNRSQANEMIELRAENLKLKALVSENFDHIAIIRSYYEHMPRPAWLKNRDGLMFFINDAYEREWNVSRLKYEGRPDDAVWGKKLAAKFKKYDLEVLTEMKGMVFTVDIPIDLSHPEKGTKQWDVFKFPVVYRNEVLGVGGIAVPVTIPDHAIRVITDTHTVVEIT